MNIISLNTWHYEMPPELHAYVKGVAANGYRDLIADYAYTSLDIAVRDFIVPAVIVSDHKSLELSID